MSERNKRGPQYFLRFFANPLFQWPNQNLYGREKEISDLSDTNVHIKLEEMPSNWTCTTEPLINVPIYRKKNCR